MGLKLVSAYGKYVDENFQDETIRNVVKEVLYQANDLNATEPASSSGKYHPIADLGEGGLVRHSIMVAEVAKILMRSRPLYDNEYDKEIVIASAVLHDICKYTQEPKEGEKLHTNFDHPIQAAMLVKKVGEELEQKEIKDAIKASVRIGKNIMTHMSRWNTSKYEPGVELPLIQDEEQRIVSDADLVAANAQLPELMIQFKNDAVNSLAGR